MQPYSLYHQNLVFRKKIAWEQNNDFNEKNVTTHSKFQNKAPCRRAFIEYTSNSSVHGLKYIGDFNLSVLHRIFWLASFILATSCCSFFIYNVFTRYNESPIKMSLSPVPVSSVSIPFPTVVICNMNNVRKSIADKIFDNKNPVDKENNEWEKEVISDLCSLNHNQSHKHEKRAPVSWNKMIQFVDKITQSCAEMLVSCRWGGGLNQKCSEFFTTSYSDEGRCCTFNKISDKFLYTNDTDFKRRGVMKSVNWTPEDGYPAEKFKKVGRLIPLRAVGVGSAYGLQIVLDAHYDDYFCSTESSYGFKIMFHNPVETPKIARFAKLISPGSEIRIVLEPVIIVSTPAVSSIKLEKRKCYFNKEIQLSYFKTYTQKNCFNECTAKYILNRCGCLPYYMPYGGNDTKVCERLNDPCTQEAIRKQSEEYKNFIQNEFLGSNTPAGLCDCLPGCVEVAYKSTASSGRMQNTSTLTLQADSPRNASIDYILKNYAVVNVNYGLAQHIVMERDVVFGLTDFVSNTGGLLGLFLGVSVLSFVEIIYYLTIKIWTFRRIKKNINPKKTSQILSNQLHRWKDFQHINYMR